MDDWRLIGLRIALAPAGAAPTLEDFVLDGCSQAEVLQMYEDACPDDLIRAGSMKSRHNACCYGCK